MGFYSHFLLKGELCCDFSVSLSLCFELILFVLGLEEARRTSMEMEDICNGHLSLSLSLTSDFLFLVTAVVVSKRRRLDPSSPVSSFPPSPPVSIFAPVTTGLELCPRHHRSRACPRHHRSRTRPRRHRYRWCWGWRQNRGRHREERQRRKEEEAAKRVGLGLIRFRLIRFRLNMFWLIRFGFNVFN